MNKKELKKCGIKLENLRDDKFYEANIIVQSFGKEDDNESRYLVTPLNYMPRKERCCEIEYNLSDKDQKEEFLRHLRDSQERLKILSLLLHKQEEEIIEFGYPKTTCYYPEPSEECDLRIKPRYRPFKSVKECWEEMQNHLPFGWVKTIHDEDPEVFIHCGVITKIDGVLTSIDEVPFSYDNMYRTYTFADGTPFGILEEE